MQKNKTSNCKYCNKTLTPGTSSREKIFCNYACRHLYNRKITKSIGYNGKIFKNTKYIMRYCIGIHCRGLKKFKSTDAGNRLCARCSNATKGHRDINEIIFIQSRISK